MVIASNDHSSYCDTTPGFLPPWGELREYELLTEAHA
jgi:hypothetical protein